MPIFEYKCGDCNKISQILHGVGQGDEEIACGHCGSKKVEKMLSSFSVASPGKKNHSAGCSCCSSRTQACDSMPCADAD